MPKKKNSEFTTTDDFSFYGREAARHKLLTKEEEISLAHLVRGGGEEAKRAKEKFFLHNMRLVLSISRPFCKYGLLPSDLIQEGSIGLMRAIEKFDPTRGFRFSTYASWWVRQAILRAIYNSSEIRIPANLSTSRNLLKRILQQNPELSQTQIQDKTGWTKKALEQLQNLPRTDTSLDVPLFEEGEISFADSIPDNNFPDTDERILQEEIILLARQELGKFPERDKEIFFEWVFGDKTFQEIGDFHNVSRERVRQIILRVTQRLREKLSSHK